MKKDVYVLSVCWAWKDLMRIRIPLYIFCRCGSVFYLARNTFFSNFITPVFSLSLSLQRFNFYKDLLDTVYLFYFIQQIYFQFQHILTEVQIWIQIRRKKIMIRIRQNYVDHADPDPKHCVPTFQKIEEALLSFFKKSPPSFL